MDNFPHKYETSASGNKSGAITTTSRQCPPLLVAEPKEFDGNGENWSPEQIFVAMVADCLILTFRAIAHASKFNWDDINCDAKGVLERIDGVNKFTQVDIDVTLVINDGDDESKGLRLLAKAEKQCLIKNSISAQTNFIYKIKVQ